MQSELPWQFDSNSNKLVWPHRVLPSAWGFLHLPFDATKYLLGTVKSLVFLSFGVACAFQLCILILWFGIVGELRKSRIKKIWDNNKITQTELERCRERGRERDCFAGRIGVAQSVLKQSPRLNTTDPYRLYKMTQLMWALQNEDPSTRRDMLTS